MVDGGAPLCLEGTKKEVPSMSTGGGSWVGGACKSAFASIGGNCSHNNLQPSLAAYRFKRIS